MTLKHTEFMYQLSRRMDHCLPDPLKGFKLGETKWYCQLYYGSNKLVHYEVSRPHNRNGTQIEIGLHFENRNREENSRLLSVMDQHLIEIRAALESEVWADVWDRGWTKLYELHPDQLTEDHLTFVAQRWAKFIDVVQPILEKNT